ncbi:menaquinone biosynthesis decarboxylase [Marispirochaeta sp.]|uniref:menaquinone biosynthesis decarboxylase n=1 Tax=Marispirochaeta sp. TaxID=2038653 RepID=UPI0029C81805|nr:menaquinone biosynthesis decarboxylase [Marispirochaeta sp.]
MRSFESEIDSFLFCRYTPPMAYKNLQDFIKHLESKGELKRISAEVDPRLEITEITDRVSKSGGPALLFENAIGSDFPVLINAFGSYTRMAMALGADSLEDKARELEELMEWGFSQARKLDIGSFFPKMKWARLFFPSRVNKAACQEVVDYDPDLTKLPVLTCWPEDGGPFFTLPMVFTLDPDTGNQNMGMYRMQRFDKTSTGMHWHHHKDGAHYFQKYRERGEKMPVAVALGDDPAVTYAATAPLPEGISELFFAGYLRGKPVETVKCLTCDIQVPANAEFVLEGYVDPSEPLRREGPFGDHTGYYSLCDEYPVFHVTCITRKKKPVYPATIVGQPPMEDCYMAKATERIFLPLLKHMAPEIRDMNLPLEGVFHNCAIIAIKKRYPGQVHKVLNMLWGLGQMMYTKMIIVVDEDVDVQNVSTVMWKVFNNIDAQRDLIFSQGPLDTLDHASPRPRFGTRLGVDATRKGPMDGHEREWPNDIVMSDEIIRRVDTRWKEFGFD